MTDNELKGTAAEFFVLYKISMMGFAATHMPKTGFDLVLDVKGRLLRVQVKARSCHVSRGKLYGFKTCKEVGRSGKNRGVNTVLSESDCDIVAFVALDIEKVSFLHVSEINSLSSYLSCDDFMSCDPASELITAIDCCLNSSRARDNSA